MENEAKLVRAWLYTMLAKLETTKIDDVTFISGDRDSIEIVWK